MSNPTSCFVKKKKIYIYNNNNRKAMKWQLFITLFSLIGCTAWNTTIWPLLLWLKAILPGLFPPEPRFRFQNGGCVKSAYCQPHLHSKHMAFILWVLLPSLSPQQQFCPLHLINRSGVSEQSKQTAQYPPISFLWSGQALYLPLYIPSSFLSWLHPSADKKHFTVYFS